MGEGVMTGYLAMAGIGGAEALILLVIVGIFAVKVLGFLRLKRKLLGQDERK